MAYVILEEIKWDNYVGAFCHLTIDPTENSLEMLTIINLQAWISNCPCLPTVSGIWYLLGCTYFPKYSPNAS